MNRRMIVASLAVFTLFITLTAPMASAENGRGRHKKIYAVPTPGKVVIDGKLDDWDLSGQIYMYVISETADAQSARFAMMYDADALYLSGVVRDTSPMVNRHDPTVDPEKGWDADTCQFRLEMDASKGYPIKQQQYDPKDIDEQVAHLTMWYYTDKQEPCLHYVNSMSFMNPTGYPKGVPPHDKYEAKYVKSEDGKGYTFEYRIPWTTLKAKTAPKAGDLVSATVQFNWGSEDGLHTAGGAAWAYDVMSHPGFAFQETSCWGKMIFSAKGNLDKSLVEEGVAPEKPMPLKFTYDVPEDSEISVQLFDQKGMMVRTLVAQESRKGGQNSEPWDGLDSFGKPLAAGKYEWKGIYHKPITQKFLFSVHNSGQPPYHTDDNLGGWGADHGCPTTVYAVGDQVLLAWSVCEAGYGIILTDLKGKKAWSSKHGAQDLASDGDRIYVVGDEGFNSPEPVKIFDFKDCRPTIWGNGKSTLVAPPGGDEKTNAATAVAYAGGQVFVSWGPRNLVGVYDAKSGDLKETRNVPTPAKLAARADGTALVISADKVVALTKDKAADLITDHLDHPTSVTLGPDGSIFVANAGKLQNVSVFSADGKYQKSIGKEGGRPLVGKYDPSGILAPGGISVDHTGQLWIAETMDYPKRISAWDTGSGKLNNEFFGGSSYFGWAWIDPKKPDEVYCHNVLWKIDWEHNTCSPVTTIWRQTSPDMPLPADPDGYQGHLEVFTAHNGHQYANGGAVFSWFNYYRDGDLYKPFCGMITLGRGGMYYGGDQYAFVKDEKRFPNGSYMWQDLNNDQIIQPEEVTPATDHGIGPVDGDLNLVLGVGAVIKPTSIEPNGKPVYDFSKVTTTQWKGPAIGGIATDLQEYRDHDIYSLGAGGIPGWARWTPEGKMVWGYAPIVEWHAALNLPIVKPGRLHGLTRQLGFAGDFTAACSYFGAYHIMTREGVYVAQIMRDGRSGGLGADVTAAETLMGQLVKPDGMNRYFLLAGAADGRVTEIMNLDTVKPLAGGSYDHTEAFVKTAGDAQNQYASSISKSKHLDIARGRAALDDATDVGKEIDDKRRFSARAAYDDQNLYVQFDVISPFDLVNEVNDIQRIFKGGNAMDIQIATDPAADPARKTPAPGDLRILVTRQAGKPVAVIFRPKVKDFSGQPIVLTSPGQKESFDKIETTDAVKLEYAKGTEGFRATMTIPLQVIGLQLKPGQQVKIDLGYLFGNATGSVVAARGYWSNNGFSAGVTNDVPNESKLEPAEWGSATVE